MVTKAAAQNFRSEFVGVCWNKKGSRWVAGVRHDGVFSDLGSFDDELEVRSQAISGLNLSLRVIYGPILTDRMLAITAVDNAGLDVRRGNG